MKKICTKCMAKPCMCLPGGDERWSGLNTRVWVRVSPGCIIQSKKALRVTLRKQKLSNGFQIPSGIDMWIPGGRYSDIRGDGKMAIPNWKLNEYIRMVNLEKLKNTKDNQ